MVFLLLVIIIIIKIIFFRGVFSECTETVTTSLVPLVTNFPEICAFIIGFSFTVRTKKSAKKVRKEVTECLQNLYQSVGIHMKYVILLLLSRLPKYLVLLSAHGCFNKSLKDKTINTTFSGMLINTFMSYQTTTNLVRNFPLIAKTYGIM